MAFPSFPLALSSLCNAIFNGVAGGRSKQRENNRNEATFAVNRLSTFSDSINNEIGSVGANNSVNSDSILDKPWWNPRNKAQ